MPILFQTSDKNYSCQNEPGKTLLELAQKQGVSINASCGGKGTCGRCTVNLIEGEFLVDNQTIRVSGEKSVASLACTTTVLNAHAVVEIPQTSLVADTGKIVADFMVDNFMTGEHSDPLIKKFYLEVTPPILGEYISDRQRLEKALAEHVDGKAVEISLSVLKKLPDTLATTQGKITVLIGSFQGGCSIIDIEPIESDIIPYGLAVDVGTTTVAGWLINLETGEIIAKSSLYNQQITLAEDVISRISLIHSAEEIHALQNLVIEKTIHPVLIELCESAKINPQNVHCAAFSGNTVMTHLLLGLDPRNMGRAPFNPVIKHLDGILANDIHLMIHPDGRVKVTPAVSGYIGGDIVSDIYVSKFNEADDLRLLIDIGTNGEMVLSEQGKMVACSTAAGPAFEGYGLYHGCRAGQGAIERVAFDENNHLQIKIIGNGKANGVCGSAIIDFIAVFLQKGLIMPNGRFHVPALQEMGLHHELLIDGNKNQACILADDELSSRDEPVVVTEADVAKILQAKAAIFAGMRILLEKQNKTWQDLDRLVLAGGFAKYIDPANAMAIGLLPNIPLDRVENIGNGSLAGAYCALMDTSVVQRMNKISETIDVIELNTVPSFQSYFIEAMWLG